MTRNPATDIVITGIGAVSPNGVGVQQFGDGCIAGKSGVSALPESTFASGIKLKSRYAAQALDLDVSSVLDPAELRRVPRMIPLALHASREALQMANLAPESLNLEQQREVGVALGTGGGGLAFVEEQYRELFARGVASLYSITAGTHGNLSSELSIHLGLRGPSHVISTGCTSSTDAIGYAAMLLRSGEVGAMLAGGADAPIAPGILSAFEKMRVISTREWPEASSASRPFSADRDGFILGEGAWMFVLETRERAAKRGATPLAEIAGYASTCDAFHRVQIAPDVAEPVRAMELAMARAGIAKERVGYVNLHGTGTELNDRLETLAMRKCFGPRADRIPMSSTKSMIGHPQGACGAAGVAATVLCMQRQMAHPTINLHERDGPCDLDYVANVARLHAFDVALCNCIAFGSKNSAIVVKRA